MTRGFIATEPEKVALLQGVKGNTVDESYLLWASTSNGVTEQLPSGLFTAGSTPRDSGIET